MKGFITNGILNGGTDDWQTPARLFRNLHNEFNFTVDAAASDGNALLSKYWSLYNDALLQEWNDERIFCNPPFSNHEAFLKKAHKAELSVFLIPARVQTLWWLQHVLMNVHCHEIRFLLRGVRFNPPEGAKQKVLNARAPIPCAIVVYSHQQRKSEIRQTVCCADTGLTVHVINKGSQPGRPTIYDAMQIDAVIKLYEHQRKTIREIHEQLNIPKSTLYKIVENLR